MFNKLERGCGCTFSGSSCISALQLLPSACCCLQTCQQISLCMCFLAHSRHHRSGSLLTLPQLCRSEVGKASRGSSSALGGTQLLSRKWWPAAGHGASFRRSRQTLWVMSEGSLNFRSPCGMLSNPSCPLGMPGVERWTHRTRTAAAWERSAGIQLCSWMKTDCNYPSPKMLFPGKWSWVGKGGHTVVPCCSADC